MAPAGDTDAAGISLSREALLFEETTGSATAGCFTESGGVQGKRDS